jgi:hypothetical protein
MFDKLPGCKLYFADPQAALRSHRNGPEENVLVVPKPQSWLIVKRSRLNRQVLAALNGVSFV